MSKHKHHVDRAVRRSEFTAPPPRRRRVSWNAVIVALGATFLGLVLLKVGAFPTGAGPAASSAEQIPTGRDLVVPAAAFADGQARFYRYSTAAGRAVSLFVIKSSDGVIRAALDACTVCYRERRGYHQEGDVMVCNNCGKAFRSADVNVITGGCNPIPLERSVEGDRVVVRSAALESGAVYF
jgi:uncharacterized membrane protein